ncbi:type VI secretion system Vgr family protein [Prevotella intermedia]|uniref:Type IV secretion protein Rhs n=1 Tax=Prevotella intermedia TaxID=28131 RepID=A0A2G9IGX1_PREIN|nr:type VI secretion system Vgr family protein [Prevotella intermedia]PIN28995.1 type IV secretion protein Rhs [Prevotella intermedia]
MSIPQTSITVSIGDTRLPSLKSLRLEQGIGCHHCFDLCIDLEAGGNRYVHNIGSSSEWLGQPITVHSSDQPIFLGVVTNVRLHREGSDFGFILISGYSATYRMETAPGCFSWLDQPIGDVVRSLCGQANVQLRLNPAYGKKLDYICQYDESDFDFVRRLALQYQEWMYYDGTSLVFGRPKDSSEPVELEYGTTLSSLEIGLQTLARPEQVFTYHSSSDREMDQPTPDLAYGHDQLSGKAFRASLGMYGRPARQHALPRIHTESELIKYMRRKQAADTAETHYVTAESHVPELRVGSVVRLYSSFLERVGQLTRESLGDFIITEIVHEVGEGSYYRNRFKAIPSTVEALPSPHVPMPVAETQMATVTSNADPNGNGRVQVRMNWQQGDMHTGWVRVMTPDAGKSGDVSSNRGFVFIPEVGDQVLLGFRHGDPGRPYVMGSLFNGSTGKGGFAENHLKSIRTRSGHAIELDDSSSSLGITIKDNKGNYIHINSYEDSIVVNAERDITFNAGETFTVHCKNANILAQESINLNAEENISSISGEDTTVQVGRSLTEMAAESYTLSAHDSNVQICNGYNVQASTISETAEKINIDSTIEDMDLSSPKKVNIQSSDKINLF